MTSLESPGPDDSNGTLHLLATPLEPPIEVFSGCTSSDSNFALAPLIDGYSAQTLTSARQYLPELSSILTANVECSAR